MSEIFLVREEVNDGKGTVRGVAAEGKYWLCALDLFGYAVETSRPHSYSIPVRPPIALVANSIKTEPSVIARTFKSFGLNRNDFSSSSAGYLSEDAWLAFLSLSGMKDEDATLFIAQIYRRFQDAKARYRSLSEAEGSDEETSDAVPEIDALRNRVRSLEEKNSSFEARLKSLEHELTRLVVSIKREFSSLAGRDAASETSKELKAYANRLYARSKQLEEQGR